MASTININKTESQEAIAETNIANSRYQNMEDAILQFLHMLERSNELFDPQIAFNTLLKYIIDYERILYSTISNFIYSNYAQSGKAEISGTLLSNLDSLAAYAENANAIATKKQALSDGKTEKRVDDTRKAVIKIKDHISLAMHQYTMLRQSDTEYDEKFKKRIVEFQSEITKEMNTQMITMVGIFTALAFLIFGSISSLDGIFENIELPIFKTISIGLIWGLCISNMIFVFLYCIGKMTKLNFKSVKNMEVNIWERYPIVWWTNCTLIALLLISLWGWFIQQNAIGQRIIALANNLPWLTFGIGSTIITILIIIAILILSKKTKHIEKK